jgi:RTX calcium-binding nonapeptide repeat (4 copies)
MISFIRSKASRGTRHVSLAASAVAAAAAVAALVAGQVSAAPTTEGAGAKPSYPPQAAKFKKPKLNHGTLIVEGTRAADKISLRLESGQAGILQIDVGDDGSADFSFDRTKVARIAVNARSGNDAVRIDEGNGAFTDTIPTAIAGGVGNDTIAGGKGVETLLGGDGNDSIDGNGGNDVARLGGGDDTFIWDPGDGSDTVEGQNGTDIMLFNGANASEQVDLSANGSRLKFFRTQANITMDTAGVEQVDFNALGGADVVTVNDLSGTDVSRVDVDLAGTLGGGAGDGQADRVIVNGTNGNDAIDVSGDAQVVKVSGLSARTEILHSQVANDRLDVNTLAGRDTVGSVGLAAGAIQLFLNGVLAL